MVTIRFTLGPVYNEFGYNKQQVVKSESRIMAYFHCRTWIQIRTQTQIPVLCRYYGKGIWIWIWISGNMFCIILCSHRVWNPSPSLNLNPSPAVKLSHYIGLSFIHTDRKWRRFHFCRLLSSIFSGGKQSLPRSRLLSVNSSLPDAGGESVLVCPLFWRVGLSNIPVIDTDISSSSWFTSWFMSWFMSESESLLRMLSDFSSSSRAWVSSTFGWFWTTCTTASIGCTERPLVVATSLFVLTLFCSALMCILSRRLFTLSSGPAPHSAPDSMASDISLSDRTSTSEPSVQTRLLVIASEISSSPRNTLWFLRYPALRAPNSS